jgi:hypothetical protein
METVNAKENIKIILEMLARMPRNLVKHVFVGLKQNKSAGGFRQHIGDLL